MADKAPSFWTLQDLTTEEGHPIHRGIEGETTTGKNAVPGLVAKDPSGNLIYLKADSAGSLIISQDGGDFACLSDYAKIAGNAALTLISEVTLQAGKEYDKIGYIVSCYRDAEFIIQSVEDEGVTDVITEHASILVGSGDLTSEAMLDCLKFTAGATGVLKLQIWGKNRSATSDMRATISCREKQ